MKNQAVQYKEVHRVGDTVGVRLPSYQSKEMLVGKVQKVTKSRVDVLVEFLDSRESAVLRVKHKRLELLPNPPKRRGRKKKEAKSEPKPAPTPTGYRAIMRSNIENALNQIDYVTNPDLLLDLLQHDPRKRVKAKAMEVLRAIAPEKESTYEEKPTGKGKAVRKKTSKTGDEAKPRKRKSTPKKG